MIMSCVIIRGKTWPTTVNSPQRSSIGFCTDLYPVVASLDSGPTREPRVQGRVWRVNAKDAATTSTEYWY